MPRKAAKPCAHPGCPNLTHKRFCCKHEALYSRPPAARRGYNHRWQKYSRRYLTTHPFCISRGQPSEVVDHIIPVTRDGSFWDSLNQQPMCESCHDRKTASEDDSVGRRPSSVFSGEDRRDPTTVSRALCHQKQKVVMSE